MDEILQQIAFVNQMNEVWRSVNDTAIKVLTTIDKAVDVTTTKINAITQAISSLSTHILSYTQGPVATTNAASPSASANVDKTSDTTKKTEKKSFLETSESILKSGKDVVEMTKMITEHMPKLGKFSKGLEKLGKIIEFGEKGIDLGKNVTSLVGESIGPGIVEGVTSLMGGLDIAAIVEGAATAALATGPVGWAIGGTVMAVGAGAAWWMAKKNSDEKKRQAEAATINANIQSDDEALRFNGDQKKQAHYVKYGAPSAPVIGTGAITAEMLKNVNIGPRYTPPMANMLKHNDESSHLKNIVIPKPEAPFAHQRQMLISGLSQYYDKVSKGKFDTFASNFVGTATTPALHNFANGLMIDVRQKKVDELIAKDKAAQGRAKHDSSVNMVSGQPSAINLTINGPLINNFSIHTKNINEAYDKVKEEVTKVLVDMFHHKIAA